MGRPQSAPGGRPIRWSTALSKAEMDLVDEMRGHLDRGAFARYLLHKERKTRQAKVHNIGPQGG